MSGHSDHAARFGRTLKRLEMRPQSSAICKMVDSLNHPAVDSHSAGFHRILMRNKVQVTGSFNKAIRKRRTRLKMRHQKSENCVCLDHEVRL
jgi:hypothetical protein